MLTLRTLITNCLLLVSFAVVAEEPRNPTTTAPRTGAPTGAIAVGAFGNPYGGASAQWFIERTEQVVKLSDEQKEAITELFAERDKAVKEYQASIKEKTEATSAAMQKAGRDKDFEELTRLQKAYQELYAPLGEITKKYDQALQKLLTAEQRDMLHETQITMMAKTMAPGIELTAEQMKKLKARVGVLTTGGEVWKDFPEILDQTLTGEQIAAVVKQQARSYITMMTGGVKLSDEQSEKVEKELSQLTKERAKIGRFQPELYQKLSEFAKGLLTEEQKEAAAKNRSAWVVNAPGQTLAPQRATGESPQLGVPPGKAESPQSGVQVTPVPGGGVQIILQEGAGREGRERREPALRERVERQFQLAKQARKLLREMDKLEAESKGRKHELSEKFEHIQGELHRTMSPQDAPLRPKLGLMPGSNPPTTAGGWAPAPALVPQGKYPSSNPAPGASILPPVVPAELQREIRDLRKELQALRDQVKELSQKNGK
jgi:hypothetical protein